MDNQASGSGTNRRVNVIWPRFPCLSPKSQDYDGIYSAPLVDVSPENIKSGFSAFSEGSAKRVLYKLNPNVLRIEEKPFDPETFSEEDNLTTVAVRHRSVQNANGTTSIESNARIVKWSDGSKQLLVGDRAFDIVDDIPRKLLRSITFSQVSGKAGGQQTSTAEDVKEKLVQIKQDQEDLCMRQEREEIPARQEPVELPKREEQVELPKRREHGDLLNRVKQFHLHVRQALMRQGKADFLTREQHVNSTTTGEHVDLRRREDIDLHARQEHPNLQMGQVHVSIQPQEPRTDEGEDDNDPVTGEGEDESNPKIDEWEYESDPDEDPDYMED